MYSCKAVYYYIIESRDTTFNYFVINIKLIYVLRSKTRVFRAWVWCWLMVINYAVANSFCSYLEILRRARYIKGWPINVSQSDDVHGWLVFGVNCAHVCFMTGWSFFGFSPRGCGCLYVTGLPIIIGAFWTYIRTSYQRRSLIVMFGSLTPHL